ncbi:MAG: GatB/YqeY domain-containing protein [Gammaproteobacteria bacterium]|nr:GatB/YqeY domain-containing protein [Gammaproteobacteria bacterium]
MTIKEQVQEQMKIAMKAQEKERLAIIRLILAEFKRIEVDERIVLDETRELALLDKMQKQRRDSIEQFTAAGRDELAAKEQYEFDIIQSFKPAAMSEQEVEQLVAAAIKESAAASMQDMAKVMAILKPKLQGRADMGQVSAKVKALLATAG